MGGRILAVTAAVLILAGYAPGAAAQDPPAAQAAPAVKLEGLKRQVGTIDIPAAKARLSLGDKYYFLGPADAKRLLIEGWENPPDAVAEVLGMIFPASMDPTADDAWGAVIRFYDIGYVHDKDAATMDADQLLADLRQGEEKDNAQRAKAGYPPMKLAGWAEPPGYDPLHHVVTWAQDLLIGDKAHTLNYDIRVLGREGVLSLNAVGAMQDLPAIQAAAASIRDTAEFVPGQRYADFDESRDKMAGIGVAGLVAAGAGAVALKKAGLLALVLAFGKKALVFIVAGGAGAMTWLRSRFGAKKPPGKDEHTTRPAEPEEDDPPPPV